LSVYTELFKDGVIVVKNTKNKSGFDNLEKIKLLKGLASKGIVYENYSWKYHYFTLNVNGIEYLRRTLNLPNNIVPSTYTRL